MTHFVSTPTALSICPRCRLPTLTAIEEGIPARVDLVPLAGMPAEVAALAAGRHTYARLSDGTLAHRDETRLSDPALADRVHAQHVCPRRSA